MADVTAVDVGIAGRDSLADFLLRPVNQLSRDARTRVAAFVLAAGVLGVSGWWLFTGLATPAAWLDEGATYLTLQRSWPELLRLLEGPDAPLVTYYALAKLWTSALTAITGWPAEVPEIRSLSAVLATLAALWLYFLVARCAGRALGLLTVALLLSLPGFVRYAQEPGTTPCS